MFLGLVMVCVSLTSVRAAPSPGCQASLPSQPHPGRHHRFNVTVTDPGMGEVTRSYILHLPAMFSPSNTKPTPLMMVILTMLRNLIRLRQLRKREELM